VFGGCFLKIARFCLGGGWWGVVCCLSSTRCRCGFVFPWVFWWLDGVCFVCCSSEAACLIWLVCGCDCSRECCMLCCRWGLGVFGGVCFRCCGYIDVLFRRCCGLCLSFVLCGVL